MPTTKKSPKPKTKPSGVEWLGDVPSHWEVLPLRAFLQLKSERNQPNLPVLSVYREYGVILKDSRTDNHNATSLDTSNYKVVEPSDLVVNKMKAWQGSLGVSAYKGIVSPAYITCKVSPKLNGRYLHYLLRSKTLIKTLDSISYGVRVGQWDMRYDDFKKVQICQPPRQEQDQIVKFLDHKTSQIDALIQEKQRLLKLLDEQLAIKINNAVTKGIVNAEYGTLNPHLSTKTTPIYTTHTSPLKDSGIEWIGEIPEKWKVKRIGYLGIVGNGSTPSRSNLAYWDKEDFPWLNSSCVNQDIVKKSDQFISKKALRDCHLPKLEKDSIVIAITGQGKTRGTAALLKFPATINQHLAYIKVTSNKISPTFLHRALKAQRTQLRAISGGGSTKGALTCQDVRGFKISIPPSEEQINILSYVNKLLKLHERISESNNDIDRLKEFAQNIISKSVTGSI